MIDKNSINKDNFKNNKGFSLIELSIVLIILGLLVAGVTGGASLIESAKQRKVINRFREFETAFYSYYSIYTKVPGSLSYNKNVVGSSCNNGYKVFTDLINEKLIKNLTIKEYQKTSYNLDICVQYIVASELPFKDEQNKALNWFIMPTQFKSETSPNAIVIRGTWEYDWSYKIYNMYNYMLEIDKKIDDGLINSGKLIIQKAEENNVYAVNYILDI